MWQQGSTLIVDDKSEDGKPISGQLEELCIPHLFFHADADNIRNLHASTPAPLSRVRLVIQDICLVGGGSPGKTDYDLATEILDKLLAEDNGPWLMVTWSTWSGSDDEEYAKQLFEHIRNELPPGKWPYAYNVLDKSDFVVNMHGTVKPLSELNEAEKSSFIKSIKSTTEMTPAMSALMTWEKSVGRAVSCTLSDLHELSESTKEHDERIGKLLYELASAEAGRSLGINNAWSALQRILNNQLLDRVSIYKAEPLDIERYKKLPSWDDEDEWRRRINRMLHFELSGTSEGPGTIYTFKSYISALQARHVAFGKKIKRKSRFGTKVRGKEHNTAAPVNGSKNSEQLVINENDINAKFMSILAMSGLQDNAGSLRSINNAEAVLIDITPACDFAQNKADTIKLCAGILIDYPDFGNLSSGKKKKKENIFKKNFLEPEYLWGSCDFSVAQKMGETSHKKLILSSRLIYTLPDNELAMKKLKLASVTKMREQILRDMSYWVGRQLSRPGYTLM